MPTICIATSAATGASITFQTGHDVTIEAILGTAARLAASIATWPRWTRLTPMQRPLPGVALFFLALWRITTWLQLDEPETMPAKVVIASRASGTGVRHKPCTGQIQSLPMHFHR